MLIIFDLDDTLIDTSGSVTPVVLKQALLKLKKAGAFFKDFAASYKELLEIDLMSSSAQESLKFFLEKNGFQKNIYHEIIENIYNFSLKDLNIKPLKGAKEILPQLAKKFVLTIVTRGIRKQQLFKLKKAGIDSSIFSKIIVTKEDKKKSYQKIIDEFQMHPTKITVVGDRVQFDLEPAKKLGCRTVHMKWGRGINHQSSENVDFVINNFLELKAILK